jgi:hypothetical protein
MSRFTIQQRKAPTMRVGRCFLAGDAAHVHSPASGQGLNTGIQDAYNLAWKLAFVVQGKAREQLLDSYTPEREPIATRLLRSALLSTRLVSPRNPLVKYAGRVMKQILRIEPLRQALSRRITRGMTALTVGYPQSPIASESWMDASKQPARQSLLQRTNRRFSSGFLPGARVPDMMIEIVSESPSPSPVHLFEYLQKIRFTLLLFTGQVASDEVYETLKGLVATIEERYGETIAMTTISPSKLVAQYIGGQKVQVILDPEGTVHRRFGIMSNGLYLIRPDGYVGYRSQPAASEALLNYIQTALLPTRVSLTEQFVERH